jgi:hypothetical protein
MRIQEPVTDDLLNELIIRATSSREAAMRAIIGLPVRGKVGVRLRLAIEHWDDPFAAHVDRPNHAAYAARVDALSCTS